MAIASDLAWSRYDSRVSRGCRRARELRNRRQNGAYAPGLEQYRTHAIAACDARTRYQLVHRLAALDREHAALAADAVEAAQRNPRQLRPPVQLRVVSHEPRKVARPAAQRLGFQVGAHVAGKRLRGAALQIACTPHCGSV